MSHNPMGLNYLLIRMPLSFVFYLKHVYVLWTAYVV
jgi:hypothetical protein